jgi:hypothetical protein
MRSPSRRRGQNGERCKGILLVVEHADVFRRAGAGGSMLAALGMVEDRIAPLVRLASDG